MIRYATCFAISACASTEPPQSISISSRPLAIRNDTPIHSRWMYTNGTSRIGPNTEKGILLIVGGRRAIVHPDGTVEHETEALPESLRSVIRIPMSDGTFAVFGAGDRSIFQFTNYLDKPAHQWAVSEPINHIGSAPNTLILWTSNLPQFFDAKTLQPTQLALPTNLPLHSMIALNPHQAVASFYGAGLYFTQDGGKIFTPVQTTSTQWTAISNHPLQQSFHSVLLGDFEVDIQHRILQPYKLQSNHPWIQWIHSTQTDPFLTAIEQGIVDNNAQAWLVSHGYVMKLNLNSGQMSQIDQFAFSNSCDGHSTFGANYFSCELNPNSVASTFNSNVDDFHIFRLNQQSTPSLQSIFSRDGAEKVISSQSGGLMITASCNRNQVEGYCVMQPNGTWKNIEHVPLLETGVGPLNDGKLIYLRGFDSEDRPPESSGKSTFEGPWFSTIDTSGKEQFFSILDVRSTRSQTETTSQLRPILFDFIEQFKDGSLRFLANIGAEVVTIVQYPGESTIVYPLAIGQVGDARMEHGYGIARSNPSIMGIGQSEPSLMDTSDGGLHWREIHVPSLGNQYRTEDPFHASPVGIATRDLMRIGWDNIPIERVITVPTSELRMLTFQHGKPSEISCVSGATRKQAVEPLHALEQVIAQMPSVQPNMRRERYAHPDQKHAPFVLFLEGSTGGTPQSLFVVWSDPIRSSKIYTSHEKISDLDWNVSIQSFDIQEQNLLFRTTHGVHNTSTVFHAVANRTVRFSTVPYELTPSVNHGMVAFNQKTLDVSWIHNHDVIVWKNKSLPQFLGSIAPIDSKSNIAVGTPTPEGVPVYIGSNQWARIKVFGNNPVQNTSLAGWEFSPTCKPMLIPQ